MTALPNGRSLDDQSFLNLLAFYRDELLAISEGRKTAKVLSKAVRRRMAKGWVICNWCIYAEELLLRYG